MNTFQREPSIVDLLTRLTRTDRDLQAAVEREKLWKGKACEIDAMPIPTNLQPIVALFPTVHFHWWTQGKMSEYLWDQKKKTETISIAHPKSWRLDVEMNNDATSVLLRKMTDEESQARFILHEIAHATGASHRLNRYTLRHSHNYGPAQVTEELVADLTAQKMMQHLGMESPAVKASINSYVSSYVKLYEQNSGIANLHDELIAEAKPFVDDAVRYLMKPLRTKRKPLPIHRQEKSLVMV